jgi:hypothetical protein
MLYFLSHSTLSSLCYQISKGTDHAFGPINRVLDVLKIVGKGAYMDTLEKYYIHRVTSLGTQINDRSTMSRNPLFDTLFQYASHRGHP